MGMYVNSKTAYTLYKSETLKPYFVDKTMMLKELFPLVKEGSNYLCITRPRRFGKTVMANMIASFFSKGRDADDLKVWYDGYHTKTGKRLYNPRSIVLALSNNNTGNYWTNMESEKIR